jgi:hypothetical protein
MTVQTIPSDSAARLVSQSRRVLPHLALWALVGVLLVPPIWSGEFWWTDEARHAMGGVFILDLVRDMPWSDPMGYALRYFAQYPALAFNWYLPGFYAVEAVVFALFGSTESVARFTVLGFCVVGASVWFAWLQRGWGTTVAFLATALFLSPPLWNFWARSVMLEAPVVSMLIVSVWAFQRYLDLPTFARATQLGLVIAGTLMIKQTGSFLLPALLIYALATPRRAVLWRWQAIPGYLIVALALAAVAFHALEFGNQALTGILTDAEIEAGRMAPRLSLERWIVYAKVLLDTWGMPLVLLSAIGMFLPRGKNETYLPLIYAWLACWYVAVTLVVQPSNAHRYTMYAFPALALLAVRPVYYFRDRPSLRNAWAAAVSLMIGFNVWQSMQQPAPHVTGFEEAADHVHETGTIAPILYAGKYDGNFIFNLRRVDERRNHVVLRADKLLVSMAVHKEWGTKSHVGSVEEIRALIERYGIEYVVIESPDVVDLKEFAMLGELVRGPLFEKVRAVPVRSVGRVTAPDVVEIYRYRNFTQVKDVEILIPLPHMGWEIRFKPAAAR